MNYAKNLLQVQLNKLNHAYEHFVTKGDVSENSQYAVDNRQKAKDIENALALLNAYPAEFCNCDQPDRESGVIKRYIYSDSGPNGSGYVKDMTINTDTGGLVILNGNGQKAKDWLKKAVDLMNKYNDLYTLLAPVRFN